jgi:hypothetical protein
MKRFPLICTIWLVASCPSWAGDQGGRFLEFQYPGGKDTKTYDLNTMQIIQPGRFTIVSTTIDNPDVMRFELKVLDTLRSHCARPEGKYPAPADLLTLGPPNMPVQNIEVRSTTLYGSSRSKLVEWQYPYTRLALFNNQPRSLFLQCNDHQDFSEVQNLFINGMRQKHLYDCKRGLSGSFVDENNAPTKAITGLVRKGTLDFKYYLSVCRAVTHEAPYVPE